MNSELAPIERPQFALRLEDGRGQPSFRDDESVKWWCLIHWQCQCEMSPIASTCPPALSDFAIRGPPRSSECIYRRPCDDKVLAQTLGGSARVGFGGESQWRRHPRGLVNCARDEAAPFLVRLRIEPAGAPALQSVIVSAFSSRIYGPHDVSAPIVSGWILDAFGDELSRQGCSLGVVSPLPVLLGYIFSELGWKVPGFKDVAIERIAIEAGRIHLTLSRPNLRSGAGVSYAKGRASDARFLADYEAKLLFEDTEFELWLGDHSQAVSTYERQLELHMNHPFLLKRLMQLHSVGTEPLPMRARWLR